MAEGDGAEWSKFISAITIHTTSWFRETPHFERFRAEVEAFIAQRGAGPFRLCSVACSSGQEVFSFALILEHYRSTTPFFDYEIHGFDIDPLSIRTARIGVFPSTEIASIPTEYRRHLMLGSEKTEGFFTLSKAIRSRCKFTVASLKELPRFTCLFDVVVCRNVLIYFSQKEVHKIVKSLLGALSVKGSLILGHSEAIDPREYNLLPLGNATYRRKTFTRASSSKPGEERVLIVDQSIHSQRQIAKELEGFTCEFARSATDASEILRKTGVDLIALDINSCGLDGLSWLEQQRAAGSRVPIVVLGDLEKMSSDDVMRALETGAQDFIDKNSLDRQSLAIRIRGYISALKSQRRSALPKKTHGLVDTALFRPDAIVIGASTGGPETLVKLLSHMPAESPPILIVQHLSPHFAQGFAIRIAEAAGLRWDEPVTGKKLQPGCIYMAGGDYHIGVRQGTSGLTIFTSDAPPENRHRPSVDFLFQSAARTHARFFGILLTGMGDDGAQGLLAMKERGAITLCQDEQSSVVFGMPKEAIALGAATTVANIGDMRVLIDRALSLRR
jgi:two-component system chemotaxis response regulator CheB